MNNSSVKMLYKPHDENENQLEMEVVKNQHVNRRFNWFRKQYLLEIGFYSMTLLATLFLLTIVYILIKQSINADKYKCPTVTILRPKEDKDWSKEIGRRTYPDPSDPLYALCGPCPRVICPKCSKTQATCPPCLPSPTSETNNSCPTLSIDLLTCPPCEVTTPMMSNETSPPYTLTTPTMETFAYTEEYRTENLCLTKNCVIQASNILKLLDSKLLDCSAFHEFSCKGLLTEQVKSWTGTGNGYKSKSEIDSNFHAVLSEITSQSAREKPVLKEIWNFYQSCLNEDTIERKGKEPLKDLIKSMGGWPVLETGDSCSTSFDLTESLIKVHELGVLNSMIFTIEFNVAVNRTQDDVNTLISFPSLGMGSSAAYIARKWGNYYEIMIDTALKLGASKQSALKSMNQVLEFETKIAQIVSREEAKGRSWKSVDLFQMSSIVSSIEWPKYLKSIGGVSPTGSEKINVTSIEFLKQINELISSAERKTICNYIVWRVILDSMPRLNRYWRQLYYTAMKITDLGSHKETCDRQVISYFHNLLPLVYFKEHFHNLETIKFKQMVLLLTEASVAVFEETFRSNETLLAARQRTKGMRDYILDIYRLVGSNMIETMFSELMLKEDDYFDNMLELIKFGRLSVKESLKSKDASILRYLSLGNRFPEEIRGFSNHLLIILATINTRQALTDLNFLNYSSFGLEIIHQLLSMLFKSTSLDSELIPETIKLEPIQMGHVSSELSCKLSHFNVTSNKSESWNEFIRDYLAYSIVEKSFKSQEKDNKDNSFLPGLNYDANQIFYINLAKTLCTKNLETTSREKEKLSEEPLRRMDFILHESESFRKSFNCGSLDSNKCNSTFNEVKKM